MENHDRNCACVLFEPYTLDMCNCGVREEFEEMAKALGYVCLPINQSGELLT